jgi:hypothetical protein
MSTAGEPWLLSDILDGQNLEGMSPYPFDLIDLFYDMALRYAYGLRNKKVSWTSY